MISYCATASVGLSSTQLAPRPGPASRFLPSSRISEWALRWTPRTASPRRSCSRRCCSCWPSAPSISPRRSPSLWHTWCLASPPPCCPRPGRSSHPGGRVGAETRSRLELSSDQRYSSSLPRFSGLQRATPKDFGENLCAELNNGPLRP